MSDLKQLLDATRTIESILEKDFGGEGRGMHEKLTSAQWPIPEYLVKKIRYIASVRNKTVHEAGYEVPDLEGFVLECQLVIRKLQELAQERRAPSRPQAARVTAATTATTASPAPGSRPTAPHRTPRAQTGPDHGRQRLLWLGALGAIGTIGALALGGYHLLGHKDADDEHAATPIHASQAVSATQASAKPATAAANPTTSPTARPVSSASPAPKAQAKTADTSAATPTNTRPHGSTNAPDQSTAPVALLQPSLRFAPGTFGDTEARISFKVRNQLQRTISSLQLDARLFIDGEATPLIDTTRPSGRTTRSGQLFVHLGERGLRAGEERTITLRQGRMDEALWRSPDVLNAQSHRLDIALASYQDGTHQTVPARSAFVSTGNVPTAHATNAAKAKAPPKQPAQASVPAQQALVLSDIAIQYAKGTFGDMEPRIRVTFTNRSQHTMAHASIAARLFIHGESQPVVTADGSFDNDAFFAHFGEGGLRAGESRTLTLRGSRISHRNWSALDILNASHRRVQLAVLDYTDRRNQHITVQRGRQLRWQ